MVAKRELITLLEEEATAKCQEYQANLEALAGPSLDIPLLRRLITHTYYLKLRDRGIPDTDKDFYLLVREGIAINVLQQFGQHDDSKFAAFLVLLAQYNVVVTGIHLLKSNVTRALFSTSAENAIFPKITTISVSTPDKATKWYEIRTEDTNLWVVKLYYGFLAVERNLSIYRTES